MELSRSQASHEDNLKLAMKIFGDAWTLAIVLGLSTATRRFNELQRLLGNISPTTLTDEQWRAKLTPEQYHILREKGTEAPFAGEFLHNKSTGMYTCAACGAELFASGTKFDSGSGWPSFYDVATKGSVKLHEDSSLGMSRVEVTCATCGGHLGHVFPDAPQTPTGQRFCINSCALSFKPQTPPAKK